MSDRSSTILAAMQSPDLFAKWFVGEKDTWAAWRAFLAALCHLPLSQEAAALYRQCTGRRTLPVASFSEAWLCCGRRSGKSLILSLVAVYLALFRDWRQFAVPGERLVVMLIARDRHQARVCLSYIKAFLNEVSALRQYVVGMTRETVELIDDIAIEVHSCSFRSIRGRTVICALLDEIGYWDADPDSAEPDIEILNALRPSLGGVRGSMLLCASSAYARRGALWNACQDHWGKETEVLFWKAGTPVMNPGYPQAVIDSELRRDRSKASAEYLSEFRSDAESYVSRAVVEALVVSGRRELAPKEGAVYYAFCDPAGGSGQDAMTLAISHHEGGQAVLDAIRCRRPPFSPETVCEEFAGLLRHYGLFSVEGDHYGGDWPAEGFQRHGISYQRCPQTRSQLFQELLPALNSGQVVLLDQPHLIDEIVGLERKVGRGGRDDITHASGAHDDMANSAAGALVPAVRPVWNPPPEAFWAAEGSLGAQIQGYSDPATGRIHVGQPPNPWRFEEDCSGAMGPYVSFIN